MDDPENFDAQSFWAQLGEDRSINPFDDQMNFDSFDPNYQQRPVDALAPGYQQLALDPLAPEGQQQQPAWPPASPASPAPEAPLSPWQFQQSPLAEGYGMNGQLPSRSYDGLMPGTTIGFDMMFDIPDGLDYENPTDLMPTTSMTDHNSRYPENGGQGQIGQLKGNTSFPLDPALQNPAMGTPKPLPTTSLTKRAEVEEGTVGQGESPCLKEGNSQLRHQATARSRWSCVTEWAGTVLIYKQTHVRTTLKLRSRRRKHRRNETLRTLSTWYLQTWVSTSTLFWHLIHTRTSTSLDVHSGRLRRCKESYGLMPEAISLVACKVAVSIKKDCATIVVLGLIMASKVA